MMFGCSTHVRLTTNVCRCRLQTGAALRRVSTGLAVVGRRLRSGAAGAPAPAMASTVLPSLLLAAALGRAGAVRAAGGARGGGGGGGTTRTVSARAGRLRLGAGAGRVPVVLLLRLAPVPTTLRRSLLTLKEQSVGNSDGRSEH